MIASYNIQMFRGNDYSETMQVTSAGVPLNLTGAILTLTAKWAVTDSIANAVFQLSTTGGDIVITFPSTGTFVVTIPRAATIMLPSHTIYLPYDLQLLDSSGSIATILNGTVVIQPSITG